MKRVNNEIYSILFTCNFDLVYDPKYSLCQVLQVLHTLIFPTLNCESNSIKSVMFEYRR